MRLYTFSTRSDFANYSELEYGPNIQSTDLDQHTAKYATKVEEYLGEKPVRPRRKGQFHGSANCRFVRADALPLLEESCRFRCKYLPTTIVGRESESFFQFWVLNFARCLDPTMTKAGIPPRLRPGKIGVVLIPHFDLSKWDGSDLFMEPSDQGNHWYASENFLEKWRKSGFKGASFGNDFMLPGRKM
jgi:hypothetical protein